MSSTAIANTGIANPTDVFTRAPNYVNVNAMPAASSAASIPIPAGAQYLRLAGNVDFYVKFGSTGVSTLASTDGSGSEFVPRDAPLLRSIGSTQGTTAISITSTATLAFVSQSWWTA